MSRHLICNRECLLLLWLWKVGIPRGSKLANERLSTAFLAWLVRFVLCFRAQPPVAKR